MQVLKSEVKVRVETSFKPEQQELHIVTIQEGIINSYVHEIISLKEKAVRDALKKLGWTPPKK